MLTLLEKKFKNLLGRYSYRQRFIFWVVIVFLVVPVPSYWILTTQYFFSSNAALQLKGSQQAKLWFEVFDGVVNNYIDWTCRLASGEKDNNEMAAVKRIIAEALETLKADALVSEKETFTRRGLFHDETIIKNNQEDLLVLQQIGEKISSLADGKELKRHKSVFLECLNQLSQRIHKIAYDYHLILQTKSSAQSLAQSIYFSFTHLQFFLVELSQHTADTRNNDASHADIFDQITITLNHFNEHFEIIKSTLETAYQELRESAVWKDFSFQEVQTELAYCYQLNVRLIDRIKANLLTMEKDKSPWPGSNSLFVKQADCLEKSRYIANKIFEAVLLQDQRFYQGQQAMVIVALAIFACLLSIFIIFRFLTSHFKQMHGYIQGLSRGNFSNRMNTNPKEEIGQIAIAFQKMGKSIEEVIEQLKALGFRLGQSTEKIAMTAKEQANAMVLQENYLENMDNNIQKISANSQELAHTMDVFTQISRERLESDESNHRLEHLQNKMSMLKNASKNILEILLSLHEKGLNTGKLTRHMTKISDQASLLALNAAIESLNVGKLQSFDDITEKIQQFSQTTSLSILAIQKIVTEMSQSVALGKITTENCISVITIGASRLIEVSHQLQTITNQDNIQNDKFRLVNNMMQNQAKRSEEMIKAVTALNGISNKNTHSVDMLYGTISELGVLSQELRIVLHALFSEEEA